jgi:hypothetical protein
MAAKKKAKKKPTKSVQATRRKVTPMKKTTAKKKLAGKKAVKKHSAKQAAHKKVTAKAAGKKSKSSRPRPIRRRTREEETDAFSPTGPIPGSAGQSGDLQGLSDRELADSESVDELLEEGNAFEADVVAGVEEADTPREVRTHEVPEDDVPDEYLDTE